MRVPTWHSGGPGGWRPHLWTAFLWHLTPSPSHRALPPPGMPGKPWPPFTARGAWGRGRRCRGPASSRMLTWSLGLLLAVLACLPASMHDWGPPLRPAAAPGKLCPGGGCSLTLTVSPRRDGGPGGSWCGTPGMAGWLQASAWDSPLPPILDPCPVPSSMCLVPLAPHRDGGGTLSFIPSSFLAPRTEGVGVGGVGAPLAPGAQCCGVSLSTPICRLRLFRELLQQPVPDPQNRGAQQGSVCRHALWGGAGGPLGASGLAADLLVHLSPGSLA